MTPLARAMVAAALIAALTGCHVQHHGDDSVSRQVGSDYFGAGGQLNLTDPVDGDAFLAGGHVATAAEVKGDLIAAGGEVSIGGSVGDDLYVGGGDVQVDALVAGNARIAGGEVAVGPATDVAGALSLTGGRLRFEGNARDYLQATGGTVRIDGTVQGDAEVRAEELEFGPQARIAGKLTVTSPSKPQVPPGVLAGDFEWHEADGGVVIEHGDEARDLRTVAHGFGSFMWILGVFVAGTLFTLAFPGYSARAADWIGREPLRSLGLGFVILVCLPVLCVLLVLTIVGIPLALVIGFLYGLLLFLGWVTAALFLGRKGLALLRGAQPASTGLRLLALLLAVLALWLLGRVPIVGGWISFLSLVIGIGALVWQGWPRRDASPREAT